MRGSGAVTGQQGVSMKKIDCEVFKPKGTGSEVFVQALEALNIWRERNPTLRVLNVETLQTVSGGFDKDVQFSSQGLRVWFERE